MRRDRNGVEELNNSVFCVLPDNCITTQIWVSVSSIHPHTAGVQLLYHATLAGCIVHSNKHILSRYYYRTLKCVIGSSKYILNNAHRYTVVTNSYIFIYVLIIAKTGVQQIKNALIAV